MAVREYETLIIDADPQSNATQIFLAPEYRAKGGDYRSREVREPQVREALVDYLTAAGRVHALKTDAPLWTRHDRAGDSVNSITPA